MSKRGTNDQQHIIDALDRGDYDYVWEKVKYIGYKKIPDINERFLIFYDIVSNFDTEKNNNFIQYYSSYIGYSANNSRNSRITTRRARLKHQSRTRRMKSFCRLKKHRQSIQIQKRQLFRRP